MVNVYIFAVLAVVLVVAALLILKKGRSPGSSDGPWPFYAKKPLTVPEQVLYYRLVEGLPGHIVLAQVQVSRVLGVKKGFSFNEWNNPVELRLRGSSVSTRDARSCDLSSGSIAAIAVESFKPTRRG